MRLICNDGTRYTKDIDIVRKCACTKKCYWLTDAANHNSNTPSTQDSETAIIFNPSFNDKNDSIIFEEDHTTEYDNENVDGEVIVPAPITQELNLKPTSQPYKLTFYYENENPETTDNSNDHNAHYGNYDGLVVQSYDNSGEGSKIGR